MLNEQQQLLDIASSFLRQTFSLRLDPLPNFELNVGALVRLREIGSRMEGQGANNQNRSTLRANQRTTINGKDKAYEQKAMPKDQLAANNKNKNLITNQFGNTPKQNIQNYTNDPQMQIAHNRDGKNLNRYTSLQKDCQVLLHRSPSLMLADINGFSERLFACLSSDIDVLTINHSAVDDKLPSIVERQASAVRQADNLFDQLNKQIIKIEQNHSEKNGIVNLFNTAIKRHCEAVKKLQNLYREAKDIEINTSLPVEVIEERYRKKDSSLSPFEQEEQEMNDYSQHYGPLLQVLIRLKSSLASLFQQLMNCPSTDFPLRSINYLANCKNLLFQLSPFISDQDCSFDRLVTWAAKAHRRTMDSLSQYYCRHRKTAKSAIIDSCRVIYLSFLCKEKTGLMEREIEQVRNVVIQALKRSGSMAAEDGEESGLRGISRGQLQRGGTSSQVKQQQQQQLNLVTPQKVTGAILQMSRFQQIIPIIGRRLGQIEDKLPSMLYPISLSKPEYFSNYIARKTAKRFKQSILMDAKLKQIGRTIDSWKDLRQINVGIDRIQREVTKWVKVIDKNDGNKLEELVFMLVSLLPESSQLSDGLNTDQSAFNLYKKQQNVLESALKHVSKMSEQLCRVDNQLNQYNSQDLPLQILERERQKVANLIREEILLEEYIANALSRYRLMLGQRIKQASSEIGSLLNDVSHFLDNIPGNMGSEITNEEAITMKVEAQLTKIEKVRYLTELSKTSKQKNYQPPQIDKQYVDTLHLLLETLMCVIEDSFDETKLEEFIDQLNFEAQEWLSKAAAVKKAIKMMEDYLSDLKKGLGKLLEADSSQNRRNQDINEDRIQESNSTKSPPSSLKGKIIRICRDRIALYDVLVDLYSECEYVFGETMRAPMRTLSPPLPLFNEAVYKQVLLLFQFKNKLRTELQSLQELLLPSKTLNYLLDELYQPFASRFNAFVTYSQSELKQLTLRLEHALNISTGLEKVLRAFEEGLLKNPTDMSPVGGPNVNSKTQYWQSVSSLCHQLVSIQRQNDIIFRLEQTHPSLSFSNLDAFQMKCRMGQEHYELAGAVVQELDEGQLSLVGLGDNGGVIAKIKQHLLAVWQKTHQIV